MEKLYIALVDTPGIFANIIRRVIGISYVHVVLSFDQEMRQAYSFGRRNPFVPFFAGFERENREKIVRAFPTAKYQIFSLNCTKEQKDRISERLLYYYNRRFSYHYCLVGLPFLVVGIPFYQRHHYTCSSFLARLLEENGIILFKKHFSLITPRDFYEIEGKEILFEGLLSDLIKEKPTQKTKQKERMGMLRLLRRMVYEG